MANAIHCPLPTAHCPPRADRRGFTLLEVILAIALSALVLAALGMAIDMQFRVVDKGRRHVEEAQLARALLHRIAADIRGAVRYDPMDITKLVPELTTQSLEEAAQQAGFGEMDFSDTEDEDATAAETTAPPPIPGIYGNRYAIQVDVSRLPRIDQFQAALLPSGDLGQIVDRTSDVKTVAYYCVMPSDVALATAAGGHVRKGLVRRELDRAVTSFAAEQGTLDDMDRGLEPIAPEVVAVEFQYFDGAQWLDEWDSDALGGLPVAVRIGIALTPVDPPRQTVADTGTLNAPETAAAEPLVYRMIVYLPASAPIEGAGMEEESTEESGDGTTQAKEAQQAKSADGTSSDGSSGSTGATPGSSGGATKGGRFGGGDSGGAKAGPGGGRGSGRGGGRGQGGLPGGLEGGPPSGKVGPGFRLPGGGSARGGSARGGRIGGGSSGGGSRGGGLPGGGLPGGGAPSGGSTGGGPAGGGFRFAPSGGGSGQGGASR